MYLAIESSYSRSQSPRARGGDGGTAFDFRLPLTSASSFLVMLALILRSSRVMYIVCLGIARVPRGVSRDSEGELG